MTAARVRLSRWVFFVDYADHSCVEHIASGGAWQTDHATARRLRHWTGFRPLPAELSMWAERQVLVAIDAEPLLPGGLSAEAAMETAWHDWYWAREVEAEREYQWLGEIVLKMPSDLFFYQEIIEIRHIRRILEIGYGRGGGIWFFASVLSLRGGGHIVGVECDPPERLPDLDRFGTVSVELRQGDICDAATLAYLRAIEPFDLVVIDAPAAMHDKLAVLRSCAALVASGGTIVVEDLTQPASDADRRLASRALDDFLVDNGSFRPDHHARRHPFLKGGSASFVRDEAGERST